MGVTYLKMWKLQYRASRGGFTAENFHNKCDGIGNTLKVKSINANMFGGFADLPWTVSIC